jgi:hypothetical protein
MRGFVTPTACRAALAAAIVLLATTHAVRAQSEGERRTLTALPAVHVQLELRGEDLAKFEVTDPVLRPEIESRLTAAGIGLLDVPTSSRTPGVPWLFLFVTVVRSQDAKEYAWTAQLELQQRACLERDPKLCESVATWKASRVGSVGRRRVKTLKEDVADLATQFVNSWVAVNAKP